MKDANKYALDAELQRLWESDLTPEQFDSYVRALGEASEVIPPLALKHILLNPGSVRKVPAPMKFHVLRWSVAAVASLLFIFGVVRVVSKHESSSELSNATLPNDEAVYRMFEEDLDDSLVGDYLDHDFDVLESVI